MSLTILILDEAKAAYELLCAETFIDEDCDDDASSIIAKKFDNHIDLLLEDWIPVINGTLDIDELRSQLCEEDGITPADIAVHELLYEVHHSYAHLGMIIRVVLLDHLGNLIVQTEDLTDVNHHFRVNR